MTHEPHPAKSLVEMIALFLQRPLDPKTITDYQQRLREYQEFLRKRGLPNELTLDNAIRWRHDLVGRSEHVANHGTTVLKSFASWVAKEGHLQDPLSGRSVLLGLETTKAPTAARHAFSDEQLDAIWAALSERDKNDRTQGIAYVQLVYATGLGQADIKRILRKNYRPQTRWLSVEASRRGRRAAARRRAGVRRFRVSRMCASAVDNYLADAARRPYVGPDPEPLLINADGRQYRPDAFNAWVHRLGEDITRLTGFKWNSSLMQHTAMAHARSGIRDAELRRRCADLLAAETEHDRAIIVATEVLEDRIRSKSAGGTRYGDQLMRWAFVPDTPSSLARLQLSPLSHEQEGAFDLFRGVAAFYRDGTHHRNRPDDFDPGEARRIVELIDHLLGLIE